MRLERRAHDVERVAVAAFLGIEMRQQLQRLDFGVVAAPDRRQRLELSHGFRRASCRRPDSAGDLAQLALRGDRAIGRSRGRAVRRERICGAAEPLANSPGQDHQLGLHLASARRASRIRRAAPTRRQSRRLRAKPRTMASCGRRAAARSAAFPRRLRSCAGLRALPPTCRAWARDRAPQRRVVLVADQRIVEVLQRIVSALHHQVGNAAHHEPG